MAHPDLDLLLNELVSAAQHFLAKSGEFYPIGASMSISGEVRQHMSYNGEDHPESQPLIDLLTEAFRQGASLREIRAAGICFDVRVVPPGQSEKSDAICVALEHQSGECADLYIPYSKGWFGKIKYGELFGSHREAQFFIGAGEES